MYRLSYTFVSAVDCSPYKAYEAIVMYLNIFSVTAIQLSGLVPQFEHFEDAKFGADLPPQLK